jgi:hypothetical protein
VHVDYEVGCELVKNDATNWGFGPRVARRPTVMVRFNPNEYDKRHVSLEERCDKLVDVLNRLIINDTTGWCDTKQIWSICFTTRSQTSILRRRETPKITCMFWKYTVQY